MIIIFKYECDSRKIGPGQTFIALKGITHDGHDYINEAISKGASHIICEKDFDISVPYTKVNDTREYLNELLSHEYKDIINNLKIIGITGTNGKTTSTYLTYQMLNLLGDKCAYIGTLGYIYKDEVIPLDNTTPDILTIYKLLDYSYNLGIKYVVMEVSSHSLSMNRLFGVNFDVIAFTNLTIDHLDYHKTMDDYLNSKLLILNHLKKDAKIIYNSDDEKGYKFNDGLHNCFTLGFTGNNFKIIKYKLEINNINLDFSFNNSKNYNIDIPLSSSFNVYNYLTMMCIVNNCLYTIDDIIYNTNMLKYPPGRCETYSVKNGYVVIDYAHTPDAIYKILSSYNRVKKGKIITIFGCGGNRDKSKRPIMGNIATTLSDYVIITNDNPRNENELDIINDIKRGINKTNFEVITNRSAAIKKGIENLENGDILLVLGKGHEEYQIIGNNRYHFSDKEEVLKYI